MVLLARKDEEGNTQTLYDHLHGAGRLASGFEDEFADISRTAAVLHDVGKVAQQFQTYLLSDDGHRGDVQHARQGAFVVNDFFESKGEIEEIAKEILELAISKHHGGLPDCIDESGNRAFLLGFTESDKSNEKYAYQEIKRGLNGLALDLQSNFRGSAEDIACFLKKIKSLGMSKDSIYFYLGLLVKLIYSRLVDADRTDAACFETRKQYRPNTVDWQNLISRLDKSMRSFDSSSEINRIRHQINEQCCLAGARETGIYRLSIPTGGGKTLASLNFALHHALKTGKHRIIYVIPYLSITTQTAKTFRDVLGLNADSDVLLEHYSTAGMQRSADVADNASSEFEDAGEHQRKLAAERWDNPIIVTTMVEFLETVMSARGTKLRKFHNMADSVIIFDEIQSLPMNTINLFNEIVSFLSKITNSTILLCSATQPLLEKTKRENLLLSEKPDLIAETESYEDKLRRTRIVASTENKSCDELGQIIYQQARKNGNCLAIVNLKKEAREIFQCLERLDVNHEFELIRLSTAMCGRHRTDCLNRIGALLDPGNPKPVICVSTQLIEAGVDISFACVVRAMAGLDSIMQAAGRCNRNGESVEPKNVYVYPLKDEDSMERYLPDIAMGKQLTLQIYGIITDKNYGFPEWIDEQNLGADKKQSLESMVDELHVSPKVKRGIIQSVRLIDDISKAVGKKPSRIFLELAGDIQASVRTTSRKNRLLELYKNAGLRKEFSDIYDRLEASDDKGLQDDRWFLYYTQLGKDMYTGEELDIDRLSSDYDIDHIIPQAVTQNDSLDNRVLVSRAANARKTDSFAYLPELVEARRGFWQELLDNRLISQTKFERLVRQNDFGRHEKERFVERSLVETRQIMKNVATLMRRRYGNSSAVIGLNSELTKEMRQYLGFEHKNRDINDYHHAQDALCLGVAGQFAVNRGFFDNGAVSDGAANAYNIYLQDYLRGYREKLKAGDRKHGKAFGFIVGSMASADENKRINPKTGEIAWSEADKDYLRRVMNYRKMLVTQKVGDSFGALYNETRYGAAVKEGHDGIAFDKNKADTSLYGGFSSAKVVYSILVELKGKVRLVNITMQEYSMLGDCPSDEALKKVLVAKKPEYAKAKILLRHIPSMQLIHYKGACMTIKSATELNNARQLWLDCDVYNALDDYLKCGTSKSSIDIMQIWDALFDAVNKHYPLHRVEESTLAKARTKFEKLDLDKQLDVLGMIVVALHADPGRANLSLVGLPSEWKRVRSVSFSDDDEFVFQSPSGLFETKITIAELKKAE